jgi:hypothetical protein
MEITTAWTELHLKLRDNAFAPTLHILDNECSHLMQKAFTKHSVNFQLVPPHVYQRNAAERAIQTWKTTFAPGSQPATPKLLSPNGTGSCLKPISLSTCSILTALYDAIGTLLPQQGIQLPAHTPCPAGHQSCRPHHFSAASQHGSPWCRRLVCGYIPRPLPLPQMLHSIHFAQLERPHCRLVPPYCPISKS